MRINGSIPFHVARAYGAQKPQAARPAANPAPPPSSAAARPADAFQPAGAAQSPTIQSLIAGQVQRPIDFMPNVAPQSESLQLYTRAADRIEAATAVQIGRSLDVRG